MNSGIYAYKFSSGREYIGQAVNIDNRWSQHTKKMQDGKHTRLIQNEYDRYDLPDFRVLTYCHPNHLDWLEAVYINTYRPSLNTTIPSAYNITWKEVGPYINTDVLMTPTISIFKDLRKTKQSLKEFDLLCDVKILEVSALEDKVAKLNTRVLEVAKEKAAPELKEYLERLEDANKEMYAKMYVFNQLPWWKRIFQTV